MPPGFHRLIGAQFTAAVADNALLIVAIALLQQQGQPGWWAPLLKFSFTIAYVVLAPLLGPLADAMPKARLMAWMNAVKLLGVALLLGGVQPLLAFAVVGLGAAAYAPAKYGLVTEMVPPQRLVVANGWIEVSVVLAALLGTGLGGLLVSTWLQASPLALAAPVWLAPLGLAGSGPLAGSLLLLVLVYGLAGLINLGIPDSGARYPQRPLHPLALWRDFLQSNQRLWADREGGLSLAVTTVFWGLGATLQFAVLRWAGDALGLPLDQAAYLQALVAVGVVAGAAVAGRWVSLPSARRVLPCGVLLGLLVALAAATRQLAWAVPLLVLTGAVGGLLVVPMNALLQHRGHCLLSAGRSIAVQGFNENLSVLAMLLVYTALLALEPPVGSIMAAYGLGIATLMVLLVWRERRRVLAPA